MFDSLKNMAQIANLMRDSGRVKDELDRYREDLRNIRIEGSAGGGAVRVKVTGDFRIDEVILEPALLLALSDPSKSELKSLAERLIAEAANLALENVKRYAAVELARRAQALGFNIPADADIGSLLTG